MTMPKGINVQIMAELRLLSGNKIGLERLLKRAISLLELATISLLHDKDTNSSSAPLK